MTDRLSTFRSLGHRNYRLYFIGQMVSLIGSWMQTTALTWLVFDLTGESKWPAFLVVAQIGPTFLFGTAGGWLADHVPKRPLILGTQVGYLVVASLLAAVVLTGVATPLRILSIMLINGFIQSIDLPARLALVSKLVPREDLINAVAMNSLLFNVARLIGPAIAGVLLLTVGPGACILCNAISYGAVLWALRRIDFPSEADLIGRPRSSPWGGFAELRRQPHLALLIGLAGSLSLCGWPLLTLLPAYAVAALGSQEGAYSVLLSAVGAGALCGALTVARFGEPERRRRFLVGGCLAVCLGLTGLTIARHVGSAGACCAVFGCGMIMVFATGQSAVQLGASDAVRGRVMAVWAMAMSGGVPVGNLILGPIADDVGVVRVIGVQAVFTGLLLLLVGFASRRR